MKRLNENIDDAAKVAYALLNTFGGGQEGQGSDLFSFRIEKMNMPKDEALNEADDEDVAPMEVKTSMDARIKSNGEYFSATNRKINSVLANFMRKYGVNDTLFGLMAAFRVAGMPDTEISNRMNSLVRVYLGAAGKPDSVINQLIADDCFGHPNYVEDRFDNSKSADVDAGSDEFSMDIPVPKSISKRAGVDTEDSTEASAEDNAVGFGRRRRDRRRGRSNVVAGGASSAVKEVADKLGFSEQGESLGPVASIYSGSFNKYDGFEDDFVNNSPLRDKLLEKFNPSINDDSSDDDLRQLMSDPNSIIITAAYTYVNDRNIILVKVKGGKAYLFLRGSLNAAFDDTVNESARTPWTKEEVTAVKDAANKLTGKPEDGDALNALVDTTNAKHDPATVAKAKSAGIAGVLGIN